MSEDSSGSRLPPPAFPPGSRKHLHGNSKSSSGVELPGGFIGPDDPIPERDHSVEDAFISPDDPIPERDHSVEDAFISPDDPIPEREEVVVEAVVSSDASVAGQGEMTIASGDFPDFDTGEEAVVTGMGHDAHMGPEEIAMSGDPHVMELVEKIAKLSEALKHRGEAGLRSSPGMDRFETTLRGYCVGYLAGRRAQEEPPPDF